MAGPTLANIRIHALVIKWLNCSADLARKAAELRQPSFREFHLSETRARKLANSLGVDIRAVLGEADYQPVAQPKPAVVMPNPTTLR
jgi:hypothetical protein